MVAFKIGRRQYYSTEQMHAWKVRLEKEKDGEKILHLLFCIAIIISCEEIKLE